ncbi:hypothetical protein IU474_28690 [Nocardia otitidiscaviarum]|uniref:hypothetical protein n=1 Tax=Nocardia otitidiscaviarum TaxID=1823 RepID=UPI001895D221|nr:hypothetical protein [Nocardia otitidiscaviarum]MBF6241029.1 hypothetical protein [Nocardia otitidiscaviarum]
MQTPRERPRLSSIQVRWSDADAAFVARSDQFPGLTHRDPHSSLAAVDGLLEAIERAGASTRSGRTDPPLLRR